MSKILIEQLCSFKHYHFEENGKYITNANLADSNVNEFLEIIHLLDSQFIEYNILNDFNISILSKR